MQAAKCITPVVITIPSMKRFAPFLLLLLLLIPQHKAHADITSNLQGWWKFDEGTGTTPHDSSSNNITTNTINTPTWVTGKVGPFALNFNGTTQYVNMGAPTPLNLTTNFTVCAWFNPSALTNTNQQIVSKGYNGTNTQYQLITADNTGDIIFGSYNGSSQGNTTSTVKAAVGTWTFACGMYNTTQYLLYTNGTLDKTTTGATPVSTVRAFEVGAVDINNTPGQFFPGSIDEVRVYNRVLTSTDVMELYLYTGTVLIVKHLIMGGSLLIRGGSLNLS